MKPLADCRLYAFVDTAYLHGRAPEAVAQRLCEGGADLIQLRAKTSPAADIRRMAERILPVTRQAGVYLVINDHLDIAREVGAEICHLGQEDFFDAGHKHVSEVRSAKCEVRIARCEVRSARCEVRGARCELRIANCEVRIAN